jgi:H+/Na+-translocating ferredoxin:NAD+ oxidoreductase subunit G
MVVKFLKQSWLVMVAALTFGLLVAAVDGQLKDRIKQNAIEKRNRELHSLFQEYGEECQFAEQTGKNKQGEAVTYFTATDADGQIVGYAMEHVGGGFADKIILLVAVDANLEKIKGYSVMKSNETPGFGDKIIGDFQKEFVNCSAEKLKVETEGKGFKKYDTEDDVIVAITGATVSSEAVTKIVNEAIVILRQIIARGTSE